jgi:MoaA/NifB/PqqE/SkfB family radical SAM enzyme
MNSLDGYINVNLFKRIIDEASAYPETVLVLHRRGESLLHPEITTLLAYVAAKKFGDVQMATNATLLTGRLYDLLVRSLTFISFSLDAARTYNMTRVPATYETVEKNILKFLEYNKGRVRTQASMVRTGSACDEDIKQFKEVWGERVDRVRIYEEHSRNGVFGSLNTPRRERRPCVMPFYEMLVYDDGRVGRCNHDWNGDALGDLKLSTIAEIWYSQPYESLRNQHNKLVFSDAVCGKCDSWYPEIAKQGTGEVMEK